MRHWTPEERQKQAAKIRQWQPWKKAGVKTPEGKARSRMNALKHGGYSRQMVEIRRILRQSRALLLALQRQRQRPSSHNIHIQHGGAYATAPLEGVSVSEGAKLHSSPSPKKPIANSS